MSGFIEIFLLGVVLPALVCGAVLLLAWWPAARDGVVAGGGWGGAVGFGGGFALAHAAAHHGWPDFPPTDVTHWKLFVAVAAALIGLADPFFGRGPWVRNLARLALCAAAVWLLARPLIGRDWSPLVATAWIAPLSAALLAGWASLDTLSREVRGPTMPLCLALTAGAGSAALLLCHTAILAQLAGACVAMSVSALVVASLNRRLSLAGGGVAVFAAVTGCLWVEGMLYATDPLPVPALLLLVAAPSAAWIGRAPGVRSLRPAPLMLVRVGAVAILAGAAVALSWAATSGSGGQYPY